MVFSSPATEFLLLDVQKRKGVQMLLSSLVRERAE